MTATLETETVPQWKKALETANHARLAQAGVKRALKAGRMTLADALGHPAAQKMPLSVLLEALPQWGQRRVRSFLTQLTNRGCPISPARQVGALTDRQRRIVLAPVLRASRGPDADDARAILRFLADHEGYARSGEIADGCGLCRRGVPGKLTGLRWRGHVESILHEDGYQTVHIYRLTASGRRQLEEAA